MSKAVGVVLTEKHRETAERQPLSTVEDDLICRGRQSGDGITAETSELSVFFAC